MLTKKYYEMVAGALHDAHTRFPEVRPDAAQQSEDDAHALADVFERDNPKFDRARFLKACGVAS